MFKAITRYETLCHVISIAVPFLIRYTSIHLSYVCSDTITHNTAKIEEKWI